MRGRYTEKEIALTRSLLEGINCNKWGEMTTAFESAYASGLFPNRSVSAVMTMASRIKKQMEREAAEEERRRQEESERTQATEQIEFTTTVAISEQMLREKHEAEKALLLLKRSIIDDALGIRFDELKFSLKSIERAAKFIWPDEYAERLSELYAEEDY